MSTTNGWVTKVNVELITSVSRPDYAQFTKINTVDVTESAIKSAAINAVSTQSHLPTAQMKAELVRFEAKPESDQDEWANAFDNNDDSLNVKDIEKVKVFYQGEVCPGCVVLQEEVREIKRALDEVIKDRKRENENNKVLLCAGDLISILYKKMLKYSRFKGLPRGVDLGELLASSDSGYEDPEIAVFFHDSLKYLGVSLDDFKSLRALKQSRNEAFHSPESPTELLNTIKSARLPGFEKLIAIAEKYPEVFNINPSGNTCSIGTEVDR